jgi:uncharacterized protein (DUF1800 family)
MGMTTTKEKTRRPRVLAGLTPYTGTFGKEQITHLLKRTMFGAKKADIDFFTGKTLAATIDTLLTEPPALTDAELPLNYYNRTDTAATQTSLDPIAPAGKTWAYAPQDGNFDGARRNSLKAWWVGNMVNQPRSIFEKMVLFWHNHFATEMVDTNSTLFYNHIELLRKYALGNFRAFTTEMTLDPCMLYYLNGRLNTKTAPDENYGRELQELFTLGKGPNSGYTEADVKAAAKVLTGWRATQDIIAGTTKYKWVPSLVTGNHDTTAKTFSAFYGNKVITNTASTQAGALKELNDMLDMIFATDEVAMYVCRRIYRFFVYYDIDATIETDIIKPLAVIFRASNYNIKPVLKALFSSEHFFEVSIKASLIKSPLENIVGFVREFDVPLPPNVVVPRVNGTITYDEIPFYTGMLSMVNNLSSQGQNIGDPPNVSGWPAYYQEPIFHEAWINTDTFPKRLRYSDQLMSTTGVGLGSGYKLAVDFIKFTDQFGADAYDPNTLITKVLEILYRVPPTSAMTLYLKNTILLDGQVSDHYWTDAWAAYKTNSTTANFNIVNTRLQKFYIFIARNPEYQLA